MEVTPMNENDAFVLVRRLLHEGELFNLNGEQNRRTYSDHDLKALAQQLDFLPLAFAQAAAFVRQNEISVEIYLRLISNDETALTNLLEHDFRDQASVNYISKAVLSTWTIGFDQIETQWRPAVEILSLMAVLEAQGIPRYLLETGNKQFDARSIDTLLAYSFIVPSLENETYDIHRLVQLAMRKRLVASNTEMKRAKEALMLLSEKFSDGDYASWKDCAILFPHALKVLTMDIYSPAEAIARGILQSKMAWYYLTRGIVEKAEAFSQRALENIEFATDAKQDDILAIKAKRIIILQKLARFDDAEDLAQEVWRERRIALGPKDDKTMESFITLSLIFQKQGKYVEAEKAIRKVLQSLNTGLPPDDKLVLEAKRRLATILVYLGKIGEAEKFAREASEGFERTMGPENLILLKTNWRFAWILHEQGKYAEAEAVNLRTWKQQIKLIGADHPDTIKSRFSLANDLQAQLKFSAAESHKREVYSKAVHIVGAGHMYSLIAASSLASCLIASNLSSSSPLPELFEEAEALYQLSLDGRRKVLREDHPQTLSARTDLANIQRLRGSVPPGDIEASERVTLSKLKQTLGREHPLTLTSRESLARILWVQRDVKVKRSEALLQAKKVLEVREKRQGWERDDTRQVAELVVEMLAEGRERRTLREKAVLTR